jgi:hypothetical protein
MGWLDKLFGKRESDTSSIAAAGSDNPFAGLEGVRFGRYSDNNKSNKKTQQWYAAEDRYKEKAYPEAFAALFDYITDEVEGNVTFHPDGKTFTFELFQGSKKVYGKCDGEHIVAEAPIVIMEKPSNAVMRRLLEQNFSLYYSRYAIDDKGALCMVFDCAVSMASPNKIYYALREMAKYADRQDDLLMADFAALKPTNVEHISPLPDHELEVKYTYFRKWIQETLDMVADLNADSFSGAIAYSFLSLLYRIDFLIIPEAKLMADLEEVSSYYWTKKDETPIVERNAMMKEGIRKLLNISKEDFSKGVYRSKSTFAITPVPPADKMKENVQAANKDAQWYEDNKYPQLALMLNEYGMMYNQFTYSMPALITELATIYMAVMHADFFRDLGMKRLFYTPETKSFDIPLIKDAIDRPVNRWREKYVSLNWNHDRINYSSLWDFGHTFSDYVVGLNLEVKR